MMFVSAGHRVYQPAMAVFARLLLLLSMLLMPLHMATAAASAPRADEHTMMAGMPMEHCPDQSSKHQQHDGLAPCSMACASSLPAQELFRDAPQLADHQLVMPIEERSLRGILQEIATPPPKSA